MLAVLTEVSSEFPLKVQRRVASTHEAQFLAGKKARLWEEGLLPAGAVIVDLWAV